MNADKPLSTYIVRVERVIRKRAEVTIVSDLPLEEVRAWARADPEAVEAAVAAWKSDDLPLEVESVLYAGTPYEATHRLVAGRLVPHAPPYAPPQEEHWIVVGPHRWASDGHVVLREDYAHAVDAGRALEWRAYSGEAAERAVRFVADAIAGTGPEATMGGERPEYVARLISVDGQPRWGFQAYYGRLLDGLSLRLWQAHSTDLFQWVVGSRDGEVVAAAAPVRP